MWSVVTESPTLTRTRAPLIGSMGAGYGDIDYDGLVDIYLTNGGPIMSRFEPNILFHNRGDRFADITVSAGVGNPGKGHGVGFADYDQDGDGLDSDQYGGSDCDDSDSTISPNAVEVPEDGIDQDCSGSDASSCDADADGDG